MLRWPCYRFIDLTLFASLFVFLLNRIEQQNNYGCALENLESSVQNIYIYIVKDQYTSYATKQKKRAAGLLPKQKIQS